MSRTLTTETGVMTGATTRVVTFSVTNRLTRKVAFREFPAGTVVCVAEGRVPGTYLIRIPGTLLQQTVYPAAVSQEVGLSSVNVP